jgi:2-keto-4-pentenoate hydratase/2-oxohepta-3-ene-1,7-dioic acid hydratase in catechol pathway
MHLTNFSRQGSNDVALGVMLDDAVIDLADIAGAPRSLAEAVMTDHAALGVLRPQFTTVARIPLADVTILAPVAFSDRPIYCVGKNYHEHAKEFASSGFDATAKEIVPEAPVVFMKPGTSIIATGEDIPAHLDDTHSVDYEGELGVVIGRGGRAIAKERALEHVFGYTIVNDVTSRVLQNKHRQWSIGKGIDGFCPIGPAILTADAVPDPKALRLKTFVNGEKRQDAVVADLIFDIPTLIATLSAYITLRPGDIIATGTPAGVGIGFTPARFLAAGDVVRVEISGIGVLENGVA